MMTDSVMLVANSTSSITAGNGTMITSTLPISDSGSTRSCQRENRDMRRNGWLRLAGKWQLGATEGVDKRGRTIPTHPDLVQSFSYISAHTQTAVWRFQPVAYDSPFRWTWSFSRADRCSAA